MFDGAFKIERNKIDEQKHVEERCLDCILKQKKPQRAGSLKSMWEFVLEKKDYDCALITLSQLSSFMAHTEALRMYRITIFDLQDLLLDSEVMDLLFNLIHVEFNNEDLSCIPYYCLSVIYHLVVNKKTENDFSCLTNPYNKRGVEEFVKSKNNHKFFEVLEKKNLIEKIRFKKHFFFFFNFLFLFLFFFNFYFYFFFTDFYLQPEQCLKVLIL